jgi:hypothetical protein
VASSIVSSSSPHPALLRPRPVPGTGPSFVAAGPSRPVPPAGPSAASFVQELLDAVAAGATLERLAEITAAACGRPVAIVVPGLGRPIVHPEVGPDLLVDLEEHVVAGIEATEDLRCGAVVAERAIVRAGEPVGAVLLLGGPAESGRRPAADRGAGDLLALTASAALARLAVLEAHDVAEDRVRGSLVGELLRAPDMDAARVLRRAGRLGCDLTHGAIALCARPRDTRPWHLVALVSREHPGALAERRGDLLHVLVPGGAGVLEDRATRVLVDELRRHGPVGISGHEPDPARLGRVVDEALLMLEALTASDHPLDPAAATSGTYRLLLRVFATRPEEIAALYEDTVAPLVRQDAANQTDLVRTLGVYVEENGNANGAAARLFAHRHTVASRLARVAELTGLDPTRGVDRELLGLGLKVHRMFGSRLQA